MITVKNFSSHQDIEKVTGMTVYFAKAYASWQRGSNEITNRLLRQFIPKDPILILLVMKIYKDMFIY